jgi:transcriptional regulator with XRE-family HTH domain
MGLFASEITRLRSQRGWTPTELAEKSGVTHAAVWQWEESRTLPSRPRVAALEAAFQIESGSLQALVDTDRGHRRRGPNDTPNPRTPLQPRTAPAVHRRTAGSKSASEEADDVDDFIFAMSDYVVERLAMIEANNRRVEELNDEARVLMNQALENLGKPEAQALIERGGALLALAKRIVDESKVLHREADQRRSVAVRLIQRTRHIVNADNDSDEVAPEKISDVARRRMARRNSKRRSELFGLYKELESATNQWFTPDASPGDVVPLLTLLLSLMNRVNDLESNVSDLKMALDSERLKRQGKPATGLVE